MIRLIFVCHGNICRSPAAECIARESIKRRGLSRLIEVSSKAVSLEEIGNDIYPPMKRALSKEGIPFSPHEAARINQRDYDEADAVYYMDESNRRILSYLIRDHKGALIPFTAYVHSVSEIEDPWYSGRYDLVVRQIKEGVEALLDEWEKKLR